VNLVYAGCHGLLSNNRQFFKKITGSQKTASGSRRHLPDLKRNSNCRAVRLAAYSQGTIFRPGRLGWL
jgi:hypothetical protein